MVVLSFPWRKLSQQVSMAGCAVLAAWVAMTAEGFWSIAGGIAAVAVLLITSTQSGLSILRWRRLRRPCRAFFVVDGQRANEIELPPHMRQPLRLEIEPVATFVTHGIALEFLGDGKGPNIDEVSNVTRHYTDPSGVVQIPGRYSFAKGIRETIDMHIVTGNSGRYELAIHYIGSEVLGKTSGLFVTVSGK